MLIEKCSVVALLLPEACSYWDHQGSCLVRTRKSIRLAQVVECDDRETTFDIIDYSPVTKTFVKVGRAEISSPALPNFIVYVFD